MKFRNDIQGLRAVAFLSVFIFHLNKDWLPGGFLGVDIFFVISGYLITSITMHDIKRERFSFVNFYKKRISRIVPAYFVVLLLVALAGSYIFLASDVEYLRSTLHHTVVFISNSWFANGTSYFGTDLAQNPLLHTWSLAIEMQFYLILPFALFYILKPIKLVLLSALIILSLYSTYQILLADNQLEMYFSLLARMPEFLVGALLAIQFKNPLPLRERTSNGIATVSVIVLLICFFSINEESAFPGFLALIPCIAVGLLLVVPSFWSQLLCSKVMVHIGMLSYSLYLWHWPILAITRYTSDSYELQASQLVLASALTYLMAYLSYHFIEKRFSLRNWNALVYVSLPLVLIFVVLTYFGMAKVRDYKYLPPLYMYPEFGMKSHSKPVIEKFGHSNKKDSILLIGDSHALVLKPFLHELGLKHNFSYYTITNSGFPNIPGILKKEVTTRDMRYYESYEKVLPKSDSLIKASKVIILNSVGIHRLPSLQTALNHLIENLRADQKLILINTFPIYATSALKINGGIIKKRDFPFKKLLNTKNQEILQIAATKENVYFFNLSDSKLLSGGPYINDTVAYYNGNHINTFASKKLAMEKGPAFYNLLQRIYK